MIINLSLLRYCQEILSHRKGISYCKQLYILKRCVLVSSGKPSDIFKVLLTCPEMLVMCFHSRFLLQPK